MSFYISLFSEGLYRYQLSPLLIIKLKPQMNWEQIKTKF